MDTELLIEINKLISGEIRNEDLTPDQEQKAKEIFFNDAKVSDISINHVSSVKQYEQLRKVLPIMNESRYRLLPVVDDNESVVGTIGQSDLVEIFENCSGCTINGECDVKSHTASEAMNKYLMSKEKLKGNEYVYVTSTDSIFDAVKKMNESDIKKVVVIESINNKRVRGILTRDAIKDYLFCKVSFLLEIEEVKNNPYFKKLKKYAKELGNESLCESESYTPKDLVKEVFRNTEEGKFYRKVLRNNYKRLLKKEI